MTRPDPNVPFKPLFADHPRTWRENRYVYPVMSRRSGGLSIGINLNPDKVCNFDCVYCQVDRTVPPVVTEVDLQILRAELENTVRAALTGALFQAPPFDRVAPENRVLRDIALSGDGEPTLSPHFPAAVQIAADVRGALALNAVRIVLITNAAYLHKPAVREALALMDANNGEIWAKLDAGTDDYYRRINRAKAPLQRILANILDAARTRPIVIQSLWMNLDGSPPPDAEVDAFAHRLREILDGGGRIRLVQVYTVARQTAEPFVTPLNTDLLEAIAGCIRSVVDVPIATFGP